MAAVALLKFEQGVNVGASGQALKGVVGELVSVRNSVNTSVASWQIDLVAVDSASAVVPGEPFAFNNNSATPLAPFTPDVPGSYRFVLKVWGVPNRAGSPTSIDIRVFAVPEASGLVAPPAQLWPLPLPDPRSGEAAAKPNEMNFGGQDRGWCGDGQNDGLLNDAIRRIGVAGSTAAVARTDFGENLIFLGATLTCDEVQGTSTLVEGSTVFAPIPQEDIGHATSNVPARAGIYRVTDVTLGVATVERLPPWHLAAGLEELALVSADQGTQQGAWQHITAGTIVVNTTELLWRNVTPAIPFERGVGLVTGVFDDGDNPKELSSMSLLAGNYVLRASIAIEINTTEGANTSCAVGARIEYTVDAGANWLLLSESTIISAPALEGNEPAINISLGAYLEVAPDPPTAVRVTALFYPKPSGPSTVTVLGGYFSATVNS